MIASKRLGAERIILLGNNPERINARREFGATDVVRERGEEAVQRVRELTGGLGAHSVLECVGLAQAVPIDPLEDEVRFARLAIAAAVDELDDVLVPQPLEGPPFSIEHAVYQPLVGINSRARIFTATVRCSVRSKAR